MSAKPKAKNQPAERGARSVAAPPAPLGAEIRELILSARESVAQAVNAGLTTLYWRIGERIRREILKTKRAEYGEEIVVALARQLSAEFGRGFGERNLFRMIRFAEAFPDPEIVSALRTQLGWTHFRAIIAMDDPLKRDFYAEMCRMERWSTRTLEKKIQSMLFERTALSKKPELTIKNDLALLREEDKLTPNLVLRDPYILDFLGLKDSYAEKDVEAAILREMESFILELGVGFAFVERQKRMQIDDRDYSLDLLFYHRKMRRLVAMELKIGEFEAGDKGQMELYLSWLKRHEREPGEAEPLGIILCAGKRQQHVELLELEKSGIHVASYWTKVLPKEELERKLHDVVRLARARLTQKALAEGEPLNMSEELTIKAEALEPLYEAWEEPDKHRVRKDKGEGAEIRKGRRPSGIVIAQNLRAMVKEWRESGYFGASDTTRTLLYHWFGRAHDRSAEGGPSEFRYYFCQREAIETLIYLKEVRKLECLSQLIAEFGGPYSETAALGVTEEEDAWSRYAFKMATGSGKTKVMTLAIVWSYFHALRESESPLTRHFVVIAPNLTVFERLKEDFKPEGGGPDIFDKDPLIPVEWRGDWSLTTVLQDEASGASAGGTLYLTNIHRLFDNSRKRESGAMYDWMGPAVSKAKALDTGAALRERITAHPKIMLMNDEAHHVWDPDSAWNEAIKYLHETIRQRSGGELVAQLDFSATPKDNKANYFKHIICDTPLGEAVDAGIIKTPIIGRAGKLVEQATDNAAYKFENHLNLGYKRWLKSREEWLKSGKKPLMFVMCEDTKAADEISKRLNGDILFQELNGRTINLHTNLKGKIKKVGKGADAREEFVESEKEISDDDLKALRKLSRDLDSGASPYFCIVSVLMLREGWDVKNVTTIVPLRPYSSKANILPEQTLGRGLRRMTPTGQANETVVVVEHEAFARLYRDELAQEGLPIEIVDVDKVPATTVSIFPDTAKKDVAALDVAIPRLTAAHQTLPVLGPIPEAEVREAFKSLKPLPLGERGPDEVQYEGRHLITGEVVEHMKVNLALLASGVGAISFYEQEIEYICKVKSTHQVLGPLLQTFFEQILFGPGHSIFDSKLTARLSDSDVREHVRAIFVPLVRKKTIQQQVRAVEVAPISVSSWRPFQVTASERRPVLQSARTLFNLVPCNRALETAFVEMCGKASDIAAFAKNAGPQCLRIDYLSGGGRLAFYTPDFFVRSNDGKYFLVETKGQIDRDVPVKALAAVEWCKAASSAKAKWEYVFVPESVFLNYTGASFAELARTCAPSLHDLLHQDKFKNEAPLFAEFGSLQGQVSEAQGLVDEKLLESLPARLRKAAEDAISLFRFSERKPGMSHAPVFSALLGAVDEMAKGLIVKGLSSKMPAKPQDQKDWLEPYMGDADPRMHRHFQDMARNLKKTLVYGNGVSPLGLLRNCLEFALNDNTKLGGVFTDIHTAFRFTGSRAVLAAVSAINEFRNTRVAHQEIPLTDLKESKPTLVLWIDGLNKLWQASKA